jgi:hypothetical protein
MTTTLGVDGANPSHVMLPVVPESDRTGPEFLPPARDPELPGYASLKLGDETDSGYAETKSVERSLLASQTRIEASGTSSSVYPWATIKYWENMVHEAQDNNPAGASVIGQTRYTVELGDRTVTVEGDLSFTSDRENFYYTYTRRALENGKLIREKTWKETIPRDHQ